MNFYNEEQRRIIHMEKRAIEKDEWDELWGIMGLLFMASIVASLFGGVSCIGSLNNPIMGCIIFSVSFSYLLFFGFFSRNSNKGNLTKTYRSMSTIKKILFSGVIISYCLAYVSIFIYFCIYY